MAIQRASQTEIDAFLKKHNEWEVLKQKLHREYRFNDFKQAFAFMTQVASVAEKNNHHPEWCNVYNTVRVDLTTHDAGAISVKDFVLAEAMEQIFSLILQ